MKLNCPECGASIPSEKINIQQMVAVCPDCGAVFKFEAPETKSKRRKVHQPQNLELRDVDDQLDMTFRTNFRLAQDGAFVSGGLMSIMFTFMTLLTATKGSFGGTPAVVMVGFALVALVSFYRMALVAYNKTHIEMDDEKITISRAPLPAIFDQKQQVSLQGVTTIRYEETAISKKEGYDLPRYNVWAETVDGSRRMIAKDLTEEYAVFIAQRLNERLAEEELPVEADHDVTHLIEDETDDEIEDIHTLNAVNESLTQRHRS